MKISILTATYNRAHTLPRLYESLKKSNHKKDFEWIIMDDGSSDNTEELIKSYQKENQIEIHYFKQKNQGKMKALNEIIPKAKGEYLLECDSDDYMADHFYEKIVKQKLPKNVYGMFFLNETPKGELIGTTFPDTNVHTLFDLYHKLEIAGDKTIVFKTKERQKYHHRLEKKEKFVTEGRLYHEMDLSYDGLLPVNEVVMIREYQEEGYSAGIKKLFLNNPYGYYEYFREMFLHNFKGMPFQKRLYILKHFILFSYLTNKKKREVVQNTKGFFNKILVILLVIPGYIKSREFK